MRNNKSIRFITFMLSGVLILALLAGCEDSIESTTSNIRIYEENYEILLSVPPANKTFNSNDPAPIFTWTVKKTSTSIEKFILEIDYMKDGSYMSIIINYQNSCALSETDWETIKNNAPKIDGIQEVNWRIRIDYTLYPEEGPYYSGWGYFWIES